MSQPFFSIGVPTYNRPHLLKRTLTSILQQGFDDFEIIVGNDYCDDVISEDSLGIQDSRIRIVNHSTNLGETENMNALISLADGKYFTWLADDDWYAPDFLEAVFNAKQICQFPSCTFTSFTAVNEVPFPDAEWANAFPLQLVSGILGAYAGTAEDVTTERPQVFPAHQFVQLYLSGKIKAFPSAGIYLTTHLKNSGGMQKLCDLPIALHGEFLLVVQAGNLESIAFLDRPLFFYNYHGDNLGVRPLDLDYWIKAGDELIAHALPHLSQGLMKNDFQQNFESLLKLTLTCIASNCHRQYGGMRKSEPIRHLDNVSATLSSCGDQQTSNLGQTVVRRFRQMLSAA